MFGLNFERERKSKYDDTSRFLPKPPKEISNG